MAPAARTFRKYLLRGSLLALVAIVLVAAFRDRLWPRTPPALLLRRARSAIEARDHRSAALLLDQLIAREPANGTALLYRGEVARDLGDATAAAAFWRRIPDYPGGEGGTARFLEGTLAFNAGRAVDAERLFLHATRLHPTYLYPRERLVTLYLAQLRDFDLRRELDVIRTIRPWTLIELVASLGTMGRIFPIADRTRLLEKFVAADSRDLDSTLALAECLRADDETIQAVELLERGLKEDPDQPRLRARLAEFEIQRGNLERAAAVLGDDLPPGEAPPDVLRAHGFLHAATNDWPRAAEFLERAERLDPSHQPAVYALGTALEHCGRRDDAVRALKRARLMEQVILQSWRIATVDTSRTDFLTSILAEIARLLMELERFEDATAWLEQALAWHPDDGRLQEQFAVASSRARAAATALGTRSNPPEKVAVQRLPGRGKGTAAEAVRGRGATTSRVELPAAPALRLVDRGQAAGLDFQYNNGASGSKFLLETLGGGVAAFDFDADGWPDLYFTQGRPLPVVAGGEEWPDRLFRNLGGNFADTTRQAGLGDLQYSQGCAAADFDNDGFIDLAVANFGTNVLYHNNGDGTFRDVTRSSGIQGTHWSSSLAFADLDRDGDLDLYVVTYVLEPYRICRPTPDRIATCSPLNFSAEQDVLYLNRGDGSFEDVSADAGILADDGKGLGILVADFDDDGWPDVYVANDGTPNFLFHNRTARPGAPLHFAEIGMVSGAAVSGAGTSQAGMGIACADFDGDRRQDLYVSNFYQESGTLYLNQGGLLFLDATRQARLDVPTRPFLGFGTQAIDVDLDGRCELFVANGHIDDFRFRGEPWKMPPQLFYNLGEAVFADVSRLSGEYFTGEYLGRGVARLDWDRDGLPELVIVHQDRPAALLHNETSAVGQRLILDCHGVTSNRDAIGARLEITAGGATQVCQICGGDGFFATNERRLIIGLGPATTAERLVVHWPSGQSEVWHNVPAGVLVSLVEGRGETISQVPENDANSGNTGR